MHDTRILLNITYFHTFLLDREQLEDGSGLILKSASDHEDFIRRFTNIFRKTHLVIKNCFIVTFKQLIYQQFSTLSPKLMWSIYVRCNNLP